MNKSLTLILLMYGAISCHAHDYSGQINRALKEKNVSRAIALLHEAESQSPNDFGVLLQLATTHFLTHNYQAATSYYEKALALNPAHINTRYNCAMAYSKCGKFDRSLKQYETVYRTYQDESIKGILFKLYIRCQEWEKAWEIQQPELWWYTENIYGKTVLLDVAKPGNGFGDCIQFMRYAQRLRQAGANVLVKAPAALLPLLSQCPYIKQVCDENTSPLTYDKKYDICIASLLICSKDLITMHAPQEPYMAADQKLISFWKEQLASDSNFKIGLCWQSNFVKDRFSGAIMPSPRSISLAELAPLANSNASFYSLQKITGAVDAPFRITQFTNDFDESHGRFMDTAALIMNMDLIITVDTSIAHLAGALGKKVWLLLACESDYRWFTNSDTSPLYPDMRLFRQEEYRNWNPVVQKIRSELSQLISHSEAVS